MCLFVSCLHAHNRGRVLFVQLFNLFVVCLVVRRPAQLLVLLVQALLRCMGFVVNRWCDWIDWGVHGLKGWPFTVAFPADAWRCLFGWITLFSPLPPLLLSQCVLCLHPILFPRLACNVCWCCLRAAVERALCFHLLSRVTKPSLSWMSRAAQSACS